VLLNLKQNQIVIILLELFFPEDFIGGAEASNMGFRSKFVREKYTLSRKKFSHPGYLIIQKFNPETSTFDVFFKFLI